MPELSCVVFARRTSSVRVSPPQNPQIAAVVFVSCLIIYFVSKLRRRKACH